MNDVLNNNHVTITGSVNREAEFSHEAHGTKFYIFFVAISRMSKNTDEIPVMVADHIFDVEKICIGQKIKIHGQFRSYNRYEEERSKLLLSVFAQEVEVLDIDQRGMETNQIALEGHICKPPVYRKTPLGREISDVFMAVNRSYGKSDYIPCICWGRDARLAADYHVGSHVKVTGRIQSREYIKKLSDTEEETRIAYEISVNKIDLISDTEDRADHI